MVLLLAVMTYSLLLHLFVQSYGGFCVVTYLSLAPKGLKCALITGGLPPIGKGCTADLVYRACFEQILHQNEKYYKRFPQDIEVVREVVNHLTEVEGGKASLHSLSWPLRNPLALLTALLFP